MTFLRTMILLAVAMLFSACVIEPENKDQAVEEEATSSAGWTEGLTDKQIVEAMPVWIETGAEESETVVNNGVAVAKHALGCHSRPKVSFCLPYAVDFQDFSDWEWDIWVKGFKGEWVQIFPTISKKLDEDRVTFSFEDDGVESNQTIKYYKIAKAKDHNGEGYSTVVTFVVAPKSNPIRVTLSDETSAAATSDLLLNGDELWPNINAQDKPQTQELAEGTVSPCIPINFQISTDFTGWDFGPYEFPHTSNSTFCKVSVVDPVSDDTAQRIKYEFEDLPLDQVRHEASGAFDYNDVVVYVDILNTTN